MQRVGKIVAVLALSWVGCEASDAQRSTTTSSVQTDAGTLPMTGTVTDAGARSDAGTSAPMPQVDSGANVQVDAGSMSPSTGDACMDAAMRIASCFLSRSEAGAPACAASAIDAAPTVARFLIGGGSCDTLTKQGITPSTPCDQAPLPQHITQLAGYEAAAQLCTAGPVNSGAVCNAACTNLPPCVDEKMLDEKLKDPAVCFDGCIRNAEDATAFSCSAEHGGDCMALAEQCWTAP